MTVTHLDHLREEPGGEAWLAGLNARRAEVAARWALNLGPAFGRGNVSWTVPATSPEHGEAVLKLQFPHRESEHEVAALRLWNGNGAVRLLADDAQNHALLLERCLPGTSLGAAADNDVAGDGDRLDVVADLLRRTSIPAGRPFRTLSEEARGWAQRLPGRWKAAGQPFPKRLVDAAVEDVGALVADAPPSVLLNADLHGDNILAAQREPWLVIDPKPLVGDPAFAVSSVVRSIEFGHSRAAVRYRLDKLCSEVGLDRERARRWTCAQTTAWCLNLPNRQAHIEVVGWLKT